MELTNEEVFNLGVAYGSFSVGDVDQGIHMILPMTDYKTHEKINWVFKGLFDDYIEPIPRDAQGESYMKAIAKWSKDNSIELGL